MPCDYKKYPANWKTVIRPAILKRDNDQCKFCKVPNGSIVARGHWKGTEVWQDDNGQIFDADNGKHLGEGYVGDLDIGKETRTTKIVLTVMHLDHDVTNNNYSNLAAGCQRCHLKHDKEHHQVNAKKTIKNKKGLQDLF